MSPRISANERPKRNLSRLALKVGQAIRTCSTVKREPDIMEVALVEKEMNVSDDSDQYGDVQE